MSSNSYPNDGQSFDIERETSSRAEHIQHHISSLVDQLLSSSNVGNDLLNEVPRETFATWIGNLDLCLERLRELCTTARRRSFDRTSSIASGKSIQDSSSNSRTNNIYTPTSTLENMTPTSQFQSITTSGVSSSPLERDTSHEDIFSSPTHQKQSQHQSQQLEEEEEPITVPFVSQEHANVTDVVVFSDAEHSTSTYSTNEGSSRGKRDSPNFSNHSEGYFSSHNSQNSQRNQFNSEHTHASSPSSTASSSRRLQGSTEIKLDDLFREPSLDDVIGQPTNGGEPQSISSTSNQSESGNSVLDELLRDPSQKEKSEDMLSFTSPEEREKDRILNLFDQEDK